VAWRSLPDLDQSESTGQPAGDRVATITRDEERTMHGMDRDVALLFLIACAGVCVVLALYFITTHQRLAW
jgi:hypothetical protein